MYLTMNQLPRYAVVIEASYCVLFSHQYNKIVDIISKKSFADKNDAKNYDNMFVFHFLNQRTQLNGLIGSTVGPQLAAISKMKKTGRSKRISSLINGIGCVHMSCPDLKMCTEDFLLSSDALWFELEVKLKSVIVCSTITRQLWKDATKERVLSKLKYNRLQRL